MAEADELPQEVKANLEALGEKVSLLEDLFSQCTKEGTVKVDDLLSGMPPMAQGDLQVLFADYLTTLHYLQLRLAGEKGEPSYQLSKEEAAKANELSTAAIAPGASRQRHRAGQIAPSSDEIPLLARDGAVGRKLVRVQHYYQKLKTVEAVAKGRTAKIEQQAAKRFVNHEIGRQSQQDGNSEISQ